MSNRRLAPRGDAAVNADATGSAPVVAPDVGFAMLYLDLAAHVLQGAANQLVNVLGKGSPSCRTAGIFLSGLAQAIVQQRGELFQQAAQRVVLAGPRDVPRGGA